MKRNRLLLPLLMLLVLCFGLTALAEEYAGGEKWEVELGTDGKMHSNFSSRDIDKIMSAVEPGDTVTFTVTVIHTNQDTAAWYMSNQVLFSLEDRSDTAAGGAYAYTLSYAKAGGAEKVIFSSDTVGGEGSEKTGEGLHGATSALEDYFYLDSLKSGERAVVTLKITLDGESQGNSYQDTKADLQLKFAAEIIRPDGSSTIVETGEGPQMWIWFAVMILSGGLLLFLVIRRIRSRRKEEAK